MFYPSYLDSIWYRYSIRSRCLVFHIFVLRCIRVFVCPRTDGHCPAPEHRLIPHTLPDVPCRSHHPRLKGQRSLDSAIGRSEAISVKSLIKTFLPVGFNNYNISAHHTQMSIVNLKVLFTILRISFPYLLSTKCIVTAESSSCIGRQGQYIPYWPCHTYFCLNTISPIGCLSQS